MKKSHLLILPIVLTLFNCEKENIIIKKDILIESYTWDYIEILTNNDTIWHYHESIAHQYTENNDLILSQSENNRAFKRYQYDSKNQLEKIVEGYRNQSGFTDKTYVHSENYVSRERNKVIEEYHSGTLLYQKIEYSLNANQVVRKDYFWFSDGIQTSHSYEIYEWERDNISAIQTFDSNHELYYTTTFEYEFDFINPWKILEPSYRPISKNSKTKEYIQYYDGSEIINEYTYEQGENYLTKVSLTILDGEIYQHQTIERFTY